MVPTMVIPIRNYPVPVYLQLRGPLCAAHAAGFDMNQFCDYMGSWYDMVADHLRDTAKPAVNPFPDDPSFDWEAFIVYPGWEIAPEAECRLEMWDVKTLAAKGMRQRVF